MYISCTKHITSLINTSVEFWNPFSTDLSENIGLNEFVTLVKYDQNRQI